MATKNQEIKFPTETKKASSDLKESKFKLPATLLTTDRGKAERKITLGTSKLVISEVIDERKLVVKMNIHYFILTVWETTYALFKHLNPKTDLTYGVSGSDIYLYRSNSKKDEEALGVCIAEISRTKLLDSVEVELWVDTDGELHFKNLHQITSILSKHFFDILKESPKYKMKQKF